jgi:predicted peptidase
MRAQICNRFGVIVAMVALLMIGVMGCSNNEEISKPVIEPKETHTQVNEEPSATVKEEVKVIEGDKDGLAYVLTIPKGYASDKDTAWPLVVMLNGYGSAYASLKNGLVAKAAVKQELPLLTLSPHREKGWDSPGTEVINLIDDVSREYKVDPSRIYLTGFSYGGVGTWTLAGSYPDRFAAIAPIAASRLASSTVQKLIHMPIWAFHNENDDSMPLANHQSAIDAVRKAGNTDVTFTVYPQSGHDSWTQTYSNPELYDWMLKHTLNTP